MKTQILIACIALFTLNVSAQNSCCTMQSNSESFAMLSEDKAFKAAHLEPNAFTLDDKIGKDITWPVADGKEGHGYLIKSEKPSNNYILVIHEWWGLNDYIKQEAEQIFAAVGNANVIAVDLYDGNVATTRDSAAMYMQLVKTDRAEAILNGVLSYAGKDAGIATIGWCFGGGWSMQTSLLAGKRSKATVMYYGQPEANVERIKTLNSPVFFVFAEQDQWINKEMLSTFENNMKATGKKLEVKSYDADHAFANPSNPQFNKEFTQDAFKRSMDFIKGNLK
jgi:carboxymethylenebutenolidase